MCIGVFLLVTLKTKQVCHCHVNICWGYQPTAIEQVSERVGGGEAGIVEKFDQVFRGEASKFLMIITTTQSLKITYTNKMVLLDSY